MLKNRRTWLAAAIVGCGATGIWFATRPKPAPRPAQPLENRITALGRLTPEGGVVQLSVPAGSVGGNEVVSKWLVSEGDPIRKGQVLARLSSWEQLEASVREAQTQVKATEALLPSLQFSQNRARELFQEGGISEQELGALQANVTSKRFDIKSAKATLDRSRTALAAAEVRSPLNGQLIQIYSWPGMKETENGLAIIGRTERMQVWAQVFQTDINRLRIGQVAEIMPETGGFIGPLRARLSAVIGQVSDKDIFATSGNNAVNARVVLVKLDIDPKDQGKVQRLTGLNVITRFLPS